MRRSPKRNGMIMDSVDLGWPLLDNLPSLPSLSRTSSIYSDSDTSSEGPLTPSLPPDVLPGFHFSTNDEHVDPAEFHRVAAQLLGGKAQRPKSPSSPTDDANRKPARELHCALGRDPSGRHCCSCGKSFTTSFHLTQHVSQCAGTWVYHCPECDKPFDSNAGRARHVETWHRNETCQGCGLVFRPGFLQKHLANGSCGHDSGLQYRPPSAATSNSSAKSTESATQQYWIYDGNHSWGQRPAASPSLTGGDTKANDVAMDFVKQLLNPMALHETEKPCELCGEVFSTEGDELAQHLGDHTLDFSEKRHRCHECQICFANAKDLERHLQSASSIQHCGLTFNHSEEPCNGHHPPTDAKAFLANDHTSMQSHLWAWEKSQLRAHRANIAGLLASSLSMTTPNRMSAQDCRRTYCALLPHVGAVPKPESHTPGLPSISEVVEEDFELDLEEEFGRIMSELFPSQDQNLPNTATARPKTAIARPTPPTARPKTPTAHPLKHARSESLLTVLKKWDPPVFGSRKSFADLTPRRAATLEPSKHKKTRTLGSLGPLMLTRQRDSVVSTRPSSVDTDILMATPWETSEEA